MRDNRIVEFEAGRRIAWFPSSFQGEPPPGHPWRWQLEPPGDGRTRVTHTYDWTNLQDEARLSFSKATTADRLQASIDRLADLVAF